MANYKLITATPTASPASFLAFTAGATNTIVTSIVASDSATSTLEALIKKNGGSVIEMAHKTVQTDKPEELLTAPFALEALDELYVRTSRVGASFVISYVEETEVPSDTALGGLLDVDTTGATDGQSLVYSTSNSQWEPQTITGGSGGAADLDGLTDVTITSSVSGDFLQHNGTAYVDVNFDAEVAANSTVFGHTTKLSNIAVTQAVDLDTMESDITANNAKVGYTTTLFSTDFNTKTTADLTEASGSKYYTEARVSANADVTANSAKISYTDAAAVTANTAKISYTDSAAVALNTAKISYTDAAAVALNTAKNTYPSGDATKVGHISVTQAVDLDTMESTIASNTGIAVAAASSAITVGNDLTTHIASIENHSDVTFAYTGLSRPNGAHLVWDTDHWGEEVSGLDHLADVDLTTTAPSTNDVLEWDGTNWVPTAPSGGSANVTIDANTTPSAQGDYNDGATIMNLTSVNASVVAGKPYYLGPNGWTVVANDNATASANTIAMCTSDSTTGSSMLREGVIKSADNLSGNVGDKVYLHTGSKLTMTEPASAATVREMGVLLDATNNIIYFKPSDVSLTIQ